MQAIKKLFVQTFEDGRNNPAKRPSISRWLDELNKICDSISQSSCGHYNIKKIIDYYMDEFSDNLSKPFVSRLNANIDKKDLYRVNEITYMLIQTLSGKERIELIGFTED